MFSEDVLRYIDVSINTRIGQLVTLLSIYRLFKRLFIQMVISGT